MRVRSFASFVAVLFALLVPAIAHAHVKLGRSDPGAGAILTNTPLQLRFWFTEAVELSVTKVTLTDSSGKSISLADPVLSESEPGLVEVQLFAPLGRGSYKVSWHTVSLDGHAASGTFGFKVLGETEVVDTAFAAAATSAQRERAEAAKRAAEAAKPVDVLAMRSSSPPFAIARFVSLTSLVLLVGAVAFWLFVLRPTEDADAASWKKIGATLASRATLAALVYLVLSGVRLYLQAALVSGNDVPDLGDISNLVLRTNWGMFWRLQVMGAALALIALLFARPQKNGGWYVATVGVVLAAFGTASTSHAGAAQTWRTFGVMDDMLHLLAVSAWLGGLFWLITAAVPLFSSSDRKSKRMSVLVNGFSNLALIMAGVVLFTGVVSARFRVGSLANLAGTTYGQVLLAKVLLVLAVMGLGFYNWRMVRPTIGTEGAVDVLRKSARTELVISLLVILVTAVLVGLPTPSV